MYIFLTILISIISFLLLIIIMIQNPKSSKILTPKSTQMFGIRRPNDFLEKTTWILSIGLFILILTFNSCCL
ncbi:MAG: preprotein translocase subunit SecG [Candidatus Walczuchella monophlebidarum]